jgi:hypothetical protein
MPNEGLHDELEPDLRDEFMAETQALDRPASQVVRNPMRESVFRPRNAPGVRRLCATSRPTSLHAAPSCCASPVRDGEGGEPGMVVGIRELIAHAAGFRRDKRMNSRTKHALVAAALLTGFCSIVHAEETAQAVSLMPTDLKWTPVPGDPEAQRAVLLGDPARPGPYVYRVKFPPNHRVPPHSHPDNRTFTVLSGTFYEATGDRFDATKLKAHPTGSFHTYVANTNFFGASRGEEVIFQISGTGPTGITYVDPKDDPRLKR